MSIGGIGNIFSALASPAAGTSNETSKAPSAAEVAKARAEAAQARQKQTLAEIREKGIYAWAQEQKAEKIKEKIREELEARQTSENKLVEGSDPATWDKPDLNLEAEVIRRMREILEESLKAESESAAARGEAAKPMVIDISV